MGLDTEGANMTKMNHYRASKVYGRQTLDWRYENLVPDRADRWLARAEQRQRTASAPAAHNKQHGQDYSIKQLDHARQQRGAVVNTTKRRMKMTLKIEPYYDYHGDPIVFRIMGKGGKEYHRCASEAEAIEQLPIIEENIRKKITGIDTADAADLEDRDRADAASAAE